MSEEVNSKLFNQSEVEGGQKLLSDNGSGNKIEILKNGEKSLEAKRSRAVFRQVSSERYFKILALVW